MFPLVPALFGAGATLNGIYSVGQAFDSYRYWNDYYKNTGYRPKYPWRAGKYDYLADIGHGFYSSAYWFRR